MGNTFEQFVQGIFALFFLFIFGTMVVPALQQATGQSMGLFYVSLFLIGIGIIFSILKLFGGNNGYY